MTDMKIYFDKNTNKFAGAINISSEYKNSKNLDFIEIDKKEWLDFLQENKLKQIKVVNGNLTSEDYILNLELNLIPLYRNRDHSIS